MSKLSDFVSEHRARFANEHDNIFAFSWSKVTRRLAFLKIIQQRYDAAKAAYTANSEAVCKAISPGDTPVSPTLAAILEDGPHFSADLHLQIESYYLFAKIVLDDVARAIEYYFGAQRSLALDSHDDLTKRIRKYATAKELVLSDDLVAAAADLKRRICDFRDRQLAHEKSPRTTQATTWSGEGDVHVMATRLYPKETDPTRSET